LDVFNNTDTIAVSLGNTDFTMALKDNALSHYTYNQMHVAKHVKVNAMSQLVQLGKKQGKQWLGFFFIYIGNIVRLDFCE